MHPFKALQDYRQAMKKPDARLCVVGMTSTKFTIADPDDAGMLDIAGFDSAAPSVMREFALGNVWEDFQPTIYFKLKTEIVFGYYGFL